MMDYDVGRKRLTSYEVDIVGEDLLIEILSKLPVKSLLRCRSVSKSWYYLTKTDYFITRHTHQHQPFHHHCRPRMFFLDLMPKNSDTNELGVLTIRDSQEKISSWRLPSFPFLKAINNVFVIGTSNGLVYLNIRIHLRNNVFQQLNIVWNPATKQYRILPKPNAKDTNIHFSKDEEDDIIHVYRMYESVVPVLVYGFMDDEYKVARIFVHSDDGYPRRRGHEGKVFRAQVFVPSTNSWRAARNEIAFAIPHFSRGDLSVILNGVLYWKVWREDKSRLRDICVMSFDLRGEDFRVIELPTDLRLEWEFSNNCTLFSWRNLLAFFTYDYEKLWVMNNSGETPVWTQQYIGDDVLESTRECLGFWNDDKFLFKHYYIDDDLEFCELLPKVPLHLTPVQRKTNRANYIIKHSKGIYTSHGLLNYIQTLAPV